MSLSGDGTVRIDRDPHRRFLLLVEKEGSISEIVGRLLEKRRRLRFFRRTNEGFARLRSNRQNWEDYRVERDKFAGSSGDGLEAYPYTG